MFKKMKTTFMLSLAMVVALSASLTGCNSKTTSSQSGTDSTKPVKMEKITVWSDQAHEKSLRVQQVNEFNNTIGKELGIEIEYTVYGSNFWDTLQVAAKAGDAPDLYRADTKWMNDFVSAGFVLPLNDMPGGKELIDKYKGMLVPGYHIYNDKVYTLPYNLTTYKFVVNTDLFNKAGIPIPTKWTWDDVRNYSKKITDASSGNAFGFGLGLKSTWTLSSYFTMPAGTNVGHTGYNYKTQQFDFAAFSPMVQTMRNMVKDGSVFPGYQGLDGDAVRAQFSEGKIGIMGAASFDGAVYNNQFPAKCNWAVVPEPSFTGSGSPYKEFVQPTQLLVIGKKASEHLEKVMAVYKFFYDDKNAAQMYEDGLYVPIRNEAVKAATKKPALKNFAEFANVPEKFVMLPMPDTLIQIEGLAYRDAIVKYLSGQSGEDAKAVLDDADKRYNAALSKVDKSKLEVYKLPSGMAVEKGK
jgi:multiple sugar transport system substrate-binding protein